MVILFCFDIDHIHAPGQRTALYIFSVLTMIKFILHTIIFVLLTTALLIGVIFSTNKLIVKKAQFVLAPNIDKLVLGHSHPECAFNDSLISNLKNQANSGESYFYTYFKLIQLLKQNKQIKTVFVEFSNNQLSGETDEWTWGKKYLPHRYKLYAPFMNADANYLLAKNNSRSFLNSLSVLLQFNFNVLKEGRFNYINRTGGYLPLHKKYAINSIKTDAATTQTLVASGMNLLYLEKMIQTCKKEHVKMYLMRIPVHPSSKNLNNESAFLKILHEKFTDVNFLDFKDVPLPDDAFADAEHLNASGARTFSLFFNQLIKDHLFDRYNRQPHINKVASLHTSSGF